MVRERASQRDGCTCSAREGHLLEDQLDLIDRNSFFLLEGPLQVQNGLILLHVEVSHLSGQCLDLNLHASADSGHKEYRTGG
jgi:hypothetical protein